MNKRALKIILTAAIVLGGTGLLIFSSLADAQYYKMVDELMVEPAKWTNKTLRVHGYVEAGSIDEKIVDQKTQRTFILENNGQRILVRHDGPTPDTFRDKSEVVAKGKLVDENGKLVLHATELMAKCPSKYEGKPKTGHPAGVPGGPSQGEKPVF